MTPLMHPQYMNLLSNWRKWRLTYAGGSIFVKEYLKKYSAREADDDFTIRRSISYCPAFAKAAINEIKNAIFSRMGDVTRTGGSKSYRGAIQGELGGIDLCGNTMTAFMGQYVLPELLTMSKVGIFVDMPEISSPGVPPTLLDVADKHPYIYVYEAANIYNWVFDPKTCELKSLLLKDSEYNYDPISGLPMPTTDYSFRLITVTPNGVNVQFQDKTGQKINDVLLSGIKRIPFICLELPDSLLADVADYQIAQLNIASSDISYLINANFPIYTEQHDWRVEAAHIQKGPLPFADSKNPTPPAAQGTAAGSAASRSNELVTGIGRGRSYPISATHPPAFIHPSAEPLKASMEKQEQMKREIRQLVQLSVSTMAEKMASAESKGHDARGLEAGLSAIGLVLEKGERLVAQFWAAYESSEPATVCYPIEYSLETDDDRIVKAKKQAELIPMVPSQTYQREVSKVIARTLMSHKLPSEIMQKIYSEIDNSKGMFCDPKSLISAVENGVLSAKTASTLFGFPEGEHLLAQEEHAARLLRISEAQAAGSPAAGKIAGEMEVGAKRIADAQPPGASKDEKKGKPSRGEGKL